MLRSYPRLVRGTCLFKQLCQSFQTREIDIRKWYDQPCALGVRSNNTPELQAIGMKSNPKGCSGTQQTPCPPIHGYGVGRTMDATDITAPELRSRGCSVPFVQPKSTTLFAGQHRTQLICTDNGCGKTGRIRPNLNPKALLKTGRKKGLKSGTLNDNQYVQWQNPLILPLLSTILDRNDMRCGTTPHKKIGMGRAIR